MKAIAVLILFVGVIMVMQGYYKQKNSCPAQTVQIKYVDRELIDKQYEQDSLIDKQFAGLFNSSAPLEQTTK